MTFASATFLFAFLPLLLLVHALSPRWAHNGVLLVASAACYVWSEGAWTACLLVSILGNWWAGRALGAATNASWRRCLVALAVLGNLLVLAGFKYASFLAASFGAPGLAAASFALPAGISFFTFQGLGYVLDVHRRRVPVQPSLPSFALFIAFFPQLVAGPILRYAQLARQLAARTIDLSDLAAGTRRFVRGLAKKVLVADVLASYTEMAFAAPAEALPMATAWLASVAFGVQIYCDFSGYTDMAIGLGRVFGFRFPENFRYPYAAASMRDLWTRWHITLMAWFRDYLLPALGRARGRRWRSSANVLVVFLVCGAWHGAAWHFVAWGAWHGIVLVLERHGLGPALARLPRLLQHGYVQLVLALQWPLFRCDSVAAALAWQRAMLGLAESSAAPVDLRLDALQVLALAFGAALTLPVRPVLRHLAARFTSPTVADLASAVAHLLLLAAAMAQLAAGTWRTFLYFRF